MIASGAIANKTIKFAGQQIADKRKP